MLNDLNLKLQYRSSHDNIYENFYKKCLNNSVKYDRAAGYFTSESLKVIAQGLDVFLLNNGKIRIVANPNLKNEDIEAIEKGYIAKEHLLEKRLLEEVEVCYRTIEDDTLNVLSWLIYKNQLDIKIAFTDNNSIYHEKFGVFTDDNGNSVAFSGSANETFFGLGMNFEKIDVFFGERDKHRVDNAIKDFEDLWENKTNGLSVIDLPSSIKEKLLNYRSNIPPTILNKKEKHLEIEPRDYQKLAIDHWRNAGNKGILEMATGTGKTITSLLAAQEFQKYKNRGLILIIVPFQHLVDQWEKDVDFILKQKTLKCMGSRHSWLNKANRIVQDFNLGITDNYVIMTTYKTATSIHFKKIFNKLLSPALLIADECHYITYKGFNDFPFENFEATLGLSATPDRWWDEDGTRYLKSRIGEIVYEYTLEQAIENNKLTRYNYNPHIVEFNESEMQEYNKISKRIINLLNKDDADEQEQLTRLYNQRANLINKAQNKFWNFLEDFKKENLNEISHTLVYCAKGEIDRVVKEISKLGVKVSRFNAEVNNKDRTEILKQFEEGTIQVLVAIKCLDEGVDVPATKTAYFLASTSNPREFVQRRGRILRTYKGKHLAQIHDYIVLPIGLNFDDFYKIACKEFPRFSEFSSSADNSATCKKEVIEVLEEYNLTNLMYKKPWDVYKEMKEMFS